MRKLKKLPRFKFYNPEFYPSYKYRKIDLMVNDENVGEGVWCLLSPRNLIKYDDSDCYSKTLAILCNASKNYSNLLPGQVVPLNFNGSYRPSIDLEWVTSHFSVIK